MHHTVRADKAEEGHSKSIPNLSAVVNGANLGLGSRDPWGIYNGQGLDAQFGTWQSKLDL